MGVRMCKVFLLILSTMFKFGLGECMGAFFFGFLKPPKSTNFFTSSGADLWTNGGSVSCFLMKTPSNPPTKRHACEIFFGNNNNTCPNDFVMFFFFGGGGDGECWWLFFFEKPFGFRGIEVFLERDENGSDVFFLMRPPIPLTSHCDVGSMDTVIQL